MSNILYIITLLHCITIYNVAFVNSERSLAKSRVDITLCQHGKFFRHSFLKDLCAVL